MVAASLNTLVKIFQLVWQLLAVAFPTDPVYTTGRLAVQRSVGLGE